MHKIEVIDSHTGGEPTRVIVAGGPDLGSGSLAARRDRFRRRVRPVSQRGGQRAARLGCPGRRAAGAAGRHHLRGRRHLLQQRRAISACAATARSVSWRRLRISAGSRPAITGSTRRSASSPRRCIRMVWCRSPTCRAGVRTKRVDRRRARHRRRHRRRGVGRQLVLPDRGPWAGHRARQRRRVDGLRLARAAGGECQGISGRRPHRALRSHRAAVAAQSKNFVLCPGKAYDRSPCGTGTSAKLACLAADGKLAEGDAWVQESILGSTVHRQVPLARSRGGQDRADDHRQGLRERRSDPAVDDRDPFAHGIG